MTFTPVRGGQFGMIGGLPGLLTVSKSGEAILPCSASLSALSLPAKCMWRDGEGDTKTEPPAGEVQQP